MGQQKPKRIQFDFSADALKQLEDLVDVTGVRSKVDVIRNALTLYEYVIKMLSEKYDLTFQRGDESVMVKLMINIVEKAKTTNEVEPIKSTRKAVRSTKSDFSYTQKQSHP
jgi:hypothetical protein